jgi:hypothetical protein
MKMYRHESASSCVPLRKNRPPASATRAGTTTRAVGLGRFARPHGSYRRRLADVAVERVLVCGRGGAGADQMWRTMTPLSFTMITVCP